MKLNSPEQIKTGERLHREYGSWSAVSDASEPGPGGVMWVVRNPDGTPIPWAQELLDAAWKKEFEGDIRNDRP